MLPRWTRLWALLCLFLAIQLATAESFRIAPRDDNASETTAIKSDSESKTATKQTEATKTAEESDKATESADSNDKSISVTATTTKGTKTASHTASSTVISSDGALDNSTFVNVTIPAGTLPLTPRLTPGWGVAGTIMLLTGIAYALIGIKNQWIHTFFSTAFVASLGVSVLIVYVMSVPISDAVQGGYVVAAVISGCGLGAASLFFRELLEVLGCALGGFCISMWLLCLKSGGLLDTVVERAIFIACFTLAGFGFYFSRYTRDWALIVLISFSGATVAVLGIDCFSRAGLKEFWAWIWKLNNDLFPLGANTYPVTKGIRVETAATIIIFLIGVISQTKLWKIVREQREKRAQELVEGQRNLAEEEETVGRNIEEMNARERRQWERVYGDGDVASTVDSPSMENGEVVNEKRTRVSHTDSSQRQSASVVEVIELSDMTEPEQPKTAAANLMAAEHNKDGAVMVHVAEDDIPQSPFARDMNDKATVAASDDQTSTFVGGDEDRRLSSKPRASQSTAPEVVPLPFVIPPADDDDAHSEGERSSVATFADDEPNTPGLRTSFAKRLSHLSHGSAEMLRNISHRSSRHLSDVAKEEDGESAEDLVIPVMSRPRDEDGSMAATIDDDSISAGDRRSMPVSELTKPIEINAQLSDRGMLSPSMNEQGKFFDGDNKSVASRSRLDPTEEHTAELEKAKSVNSAATSSRVSLTKDRLPRSMSRVAMSYRTNEWAKHLSQAETPEPDELQIFMAKNQDQNRESAAPVVVEDLKKTADEGKQPPAPMNRSDSRTSMLSYSASHRGSKQHVPAALAILNGDGQTRSPGTTPTGASMPRTSSTSMMRRTSGGGPIEPIAEEQAGTVQPKPILEEVDELREQSLSPPHPAEGQRSPTPGLISYSSPQTLIGQREMFLRNKSQGNLLASPSDLNLHRTSSDAGSLNNYAMYAAGVGADADDLPLSQRKQLMRQNSLNPAASTHSLARLSGGHESPNDLPFDSHQPQRVSSIPTSAAREAALSTFRQQVAHDLRSGTPVVNNTGRETPFAPMSLLGGREAEVQRNIEMGRNILMGQKEAEAQRRERDQRQKEWNDRAFDERMRSGDLLEAHREAMRKMQKHANDR